MNSVRDLISCHFQTDQPLTMARILDLSKVPLNSHCGEVIRPVVYAAVACMKQCDPHPEVRKHILMALLTHCEIIVNG